tara:strand:- start:3290 stop:3955 length:666 start_codon:yes stop_codon:yes gene_type:complete
MKAMLKKIGGKSFKKISTDSTKTMMIGAMIVHLIVNVIIFFVVKDDNNNKEKKKTTFIVHAIISSVVFGLLMLIKLFGLIPYVGEALKQPIFEGGYSYIGVPFFIHLVASIVTAVLSSVIPDYDPQILSNIFNGISTLVCSITLFFACFKTEDLNMMAEKAQKAAGAGTSGTENQVEAAAAAVKDPGTAATGLNDASGLKQEEVEVKAFGKRQRRRNKINF